MRKALIISFMPVLFLSVYDVVQRVAVVLFDIHPVVFVVLTIFSSAFVLLVISHSGNHGMDTIRNPYTWLYSFIDVGMNLTFIFIVTYITTTEANFLARFCIPLAVLFSWFFRGQPQKWYDIVSALASLVACSIIAYDIEGSIQAPVFALIAIYSIGLVGRAFTSEMHPQSNKSNKIIDRCRTTGFILFIMGLLFLGISLGGAYLNEHMESDANGVFLNAMPVYADFFHPTTVFAALLSGALLYGPGTFFFFYANNIAKANMVLSITAFVPFTVYIVEIVTSKFVPLDISSISTKDLLAGALSVLGTLLVIYMQSSEYKKVNNNGRR